VFSSQQGTGEPACLANHAGELKSQECMDDDEDHKEQVFTLEQVPTKEGGTAFRLKNQGQYVAVKWDGAGSGILAGPGASRCP
jgi:hypothetical protein